MTEPGTTISRAAVAESFDHWRSIKDPRSSSAKALRKAEERGARDSAATAELAADASTVAQLDRRAGAVAATRVLTPARIVQGRATAAEMPVDPRGYTDADIAALRARAAADEALPQATRTRSVSTGRRQPFTRAMAHNYVGSNDPDQRTASEIFSAKRRLPGKVV